MTDALRLAIMLVVQNTITLGVAFGLPLDDAQTAAITGMGNSVMLLVMFFWKSGQQAGN